MDKLEPSPRVQASQSRLPNSLQVRHFARNRKVRYPSLLAVKGKLLSDIWRMETLAIKRNASDLLAGGQSLAETEDYIARSLDALELKICVEAVAYQTAERAFSRVLNRRRPPRGRG